MLERHGKVEKMRLTSICFLVGFFWKCTCERKCIKIYAKISSAPTVNIFWNRTSSSAAHLRCHSGSISSQSVEMGFIFFLLSLTPLVLFLVYAHSSAVFALSLIIMKKAVYILCQTSLKWDAIWLLLYRPALTMPPVSPYKGLPCYRRLDETKFKRLKTGQTNNNVSSRVYEDLKNRALSLYSFVKQAWVNAEQVMTVFFGFII